MDSEHDHVSRSGHHSPQRWLGADVGMTAQLMHEACSPL